MDALLTWLRELGLERYATIFAENDVDLAALRLLSDVELEKLGVSLGHRKKLLRAIEELCASDTIGPPRSPESYAPKHLPEKILLSKSALEGERKQVTVLFADLKGSMELLADRDPEEARKILDPVLERMMEAVHHYEGTVNQVMGDGIMALFGAPVAHEDHAVRACYAALRMQDSLKRYTEDTRRSHGVEIQIRVGLNSGDVVVRAIGSDLHMDYTAVGQTTHLAARMEQLAPPGSVRLTAETMQLAEGYVEVRSQAGTRALDRSALRDALTHFDQARVALQELPQSREWTEQRIDLCFKQRNALYPLGEFARLSEVLSETHALAAWLGDQRRLGWLLSYQAIHHSLLGEPARAIEAGQSACAMAEAVGDLGLRVNATNYLGQALWYAGDPRRAAEPARAVIALLEGAPPGERFGLPGLPAVLGRWFLAVVLAELGEFAQAFAAGEEGLRIAQAAGHPYSEVLARWGLGYAHHRRGDFAAATRVLGPGLASCREMGVRLVLPIVSAFLGSAYLWSGRVADAVPLLEEAVDLITATRMVGHRSWIITFRAEAYLFLGRVAEAREQGEQAVAVARTQQARGWEAWGLKLLGDVHAHTLAELESDRAEQAGDAYRQALALATELGMRPLVAHCHFGLGRLYRQTSKREEAQEHFTTATTMYRETDMQFWLERAEADVLGLN